MKRKIITLIVLGLIGSPNLVVASTMIENSSIVTEVENQEILPTRYDGRAYTSSVKNQAGNGSCWNFIANGILESSLMKKFNITQSDYFDFSEDDMDRMTSKTYGGTYGFEREYGEEGFFDIALAYWTRSEKNGPIDEKNGTLAPYYVMQTASLAGCDWSNTSERELYLKQIKELVFKYGSVTASYWCSSYSAGNVFYSAYPYNTQKDLAYYYPGNSTANHGSIIVGWDDEFSRENFNAACKPSRDGAFLVKNSWGTSWGNMGYFWVSYDTAMYDINGIVDVRNNDFFNQIYSYDVHGALGSMSASSKSTTSAYMNVYETQNAEETLTALSTYITSAENTYKLYVAQDGNLAHLKEVKAQNVINYSEEKGYEMPYAGYMTFELAEPLKVQGKFIVAIEVTTPDKETYGVPIETRSQKYCPNVESALQRGYIATNIQALISGQRYDAGKEGANVCLRAFTK